MRQILTTIQQKSVSNVVVDIGVDVRLQMSFIISFRYKPGYKLITVRTDAVQYISINSSVISGCGQLSAVVNYSVIAEVNIIYGSTFEEAAATGVEHW